MSDLDLTPPAKPSKAEKAPKAPKAPKAEKVAKSEADPNAPKKERGPRQDYGFAKDAVIRITTDSEKPKGYRGQRKEWYDLLVAHDGKTVQEFLDAAKDRKDPPRGWLRFYVQDGAASLEKPVVATV